MSATVAIILSVICVIASGLMHFGLYWWREGQRARDLNIVIKAVHDQGNRLYRLELKFAAMTGKVNGDSFHTEED